MREIDDTHDGRAPKRMRKAGPRPDGQIDIRAVLEEPVRVKRDGAVKAIDPYEAMLRQHVRKSLIEKCVTSMKFVLVEAEKHKVIKRQTETRFEGNVFVVPKELPEDIQRKIFDDPDYISGQQKSMSPIWALVLSKVSFERFLECFNGRNKLK